METEGHLSNKWLKASILGCLWASSEIVLGSFLHNLHIPFRSCMLTGIGIVLLISVSYLWKETGLFWRAGLICALMKSISPSAIILGPMIGIFSEALLLESAVRIFRRNVFSFLIGGVLAMSWNLFQIIANYIIIYGFNIIVLYSKLAGFAEKQLNFHFNNLWSPILILLFFYIFLGLIAAVTGIYIGKKAQKRPAELKGIDLKKVIDIQSGKPEVSFHHSIIWLGANILGVITVLCLMNYTAWIFWVFSGFVIIAVWTLRYHRALRPLKKPRFWILFILITMLSGFLFAGLQCDYKSITEGLMAGIQMNFRAALMIVGFSTIGTELSNPSIRKLFIRTTFRPLLLSLEVAFDTLPFVIGNMPDFKEIFKKPVSILHHLVSQADFWLEKVTLNMKEKPFILIITGAIGGGKTTLMMEILEYFKRNNVKTGGIISPCVIENDVRIGNDLINASTGEKMILSRLDKIPGLVQVGQYFFSKEGIDFGKQALLPENNTGAEVIMIDEIGPWELENEGWAPSVNKLLLKSGIPMIWVVRDTIVNLIVENWNLNTYTIFRTGECNAEEIVRTLCELRQRYNDLVKMTVM